MRGNARLGQRITDELARVLKLHGLGQLEGSGDSLRLRRGSGEIVVERLCRIEARDRKIEHCFVEMTGTPLAARLENLNALTGCLAV